LSVRCHNLEEISLPAALGELQVLSLFGEKTLLVLDGIEKVKKPEWDTLSEVVSTLNSAYLILLGTKADASFIKGAKNNLLTLDLSDEKPWHKKQRLEGQLVRQVKKCGKDITVEALNALMDAVGIEAQALEQRLETLITFTGERKQISIQDVKELIPHSKEQKGWEVAESLIIGNNFTYQPIDSADLGFYFHQMRSQLSRWIQIKEGKAPSGLSPQMVNKISQKISLFNKSYFEELLVLLFELDIENRERGVPAASIWKYVVAKVEGMKQIQTNSEATRSYRSAPRFVNAT